MANYRLRIGFPSGYFLSASAGSYTLTGIDATLLRPSASTITPSLVAIRSSGPVPYASAFDATGTTVPGMTAPEVFRRCNFLFEVQQAGVTVSGTYTTTGLPRYSQGGGPIAAFNILTAGSYTVKLTVTKGLPWVAPAGTEAPFNYEIGDLVTRSGSTYTCAIAHAASASFTPGSSSRWTLVQASLDQATTSVAVTANDQDAAFPTTATVCINTSGTNDGLGPAGCTYASTPGTLASNKRYLFKRGQTGFGNISVPMGTSNIVISAYGTGAQPIVGTIVGAEQAGNSNYANTIIIDNVQASYIAGPVGHYRWTVSRNTVRATDPHVAGPYQDGLIVNGGALQFTVDHFSGDITTIAWPREWNIFENDCDGENVVFPNQFTPAGGYTTFGIAAYIFKGGCVANVSNHHLEHSMRIWGSYKGFLGHNDARGFCTKDNSRACIKSMAGGANFTYSDNIVGPWTYQNCQASQFTVYADNVFGVLGQFTGNYMSGPSPQNADNGTCEITRDLIWERNIYTRPTGGGVWVTDNHPVASRMTMRGNTATQNGSAVPFDASCSGPGQYDNQSADAAATFQRANGCAPYYGQSNSSF